MKTCSKCNVDKPSDQFHADRRTKDGTRHACKKCTNLASKIWRKANPCKSEEANRVWRAANRERYLSKKREWANAHPEGAAARCLKWQMRNPGVGSARACAWAKANQDKASEHSRVWRKNNPEKRAIYQLNRRTRKANATPGWFSSFDAFVIEEAYALITIRKATTGIDWQLDHTIPIAGRNVCGLHVAANLQLLPALDNQRKGSRHDPETFSNAGGGLFQGVTA